MPYPTKLLAEGEQIIKDTRLHWIALFKEILYTAGLLILLIVLLAATNLAGWFYLLLIFFWAAGSVRGITDWFTSNLVLTNRRLIFRKGLISKKGYEIPVDRVQDVGFRQSGIQRMVGSGDLLVESGGGDSTTALRNVPDAIEMKRLISEAREARIDQRFSQAGRGMAGGAPAPQTGASRAEQLEILARLHQQGSLSDTEFESEKAKLLGGE
jgi:uncharacterized membrane protein YdbT with pleckstrin-like domain